MAQLLVSVLAMWDTCAEFQALDFNLFSLHCYRHLRYEPVNLWSFSFFSLSACAGIAVSVTAFQTNKKSTINFFKKYIYVRNRKDIENAVAYYSSLHRWPWPFMLSQSKARSHELHPDLPCRSRNPRAWVITTATQCVHYPEAGLRHRLQDLVPDAPKWT